MTRRLYQFANNTRRKGKEYLYNKGILQLPIAVATDIEHVVSSALKKENDIRFTNEELSVICEFLRANSRDDAYESLIYENNKIITKKTLITILIYASIKFEKYEYEDFTLIDAYKKKRAAKFELILLSVCSKIINTKTMNLNMDIPQSEKTDKTDKIILSIKQFVDHIHEHKIKVKRILDIANSMCNKDSRWFIIY